MAGGVLAILQARTSSARLPGKVLEPILGVPMVLRQVERVGRARELDGLVLATSVDPSDDALASVCEAAGVEVFRGSLDDVLDRFHSAATAKRPDHVVRLTADCPLADPSVIDAVVRHHLEGGFEYTSNTLVPTFPDGLDVEVVRFDTLDVAWREATAQRDREHVMPFIWSRPERFALGSYEADVDRSGLRWTVDEQADLALVRAVYEALYPVDASFDTDQVLGYLQDHPELTALNAGIARNEGLRSSMAQEETD